MEIVRGTCVLDRPAIVSETVVGYTVVPIGPGLNLDRVVVLYVHRPINVQHDVVDEVSV
jgi:hypothetical protein